MMSFTNCRAYPVMICLALGGVPGEASRMAAHPAVPATPRAGYVQIDPAWSLKGGMITGGFLGPEARAEWPAWMQALVAGREGVSSEELGRADLYKIPDAFLARGLKVLEANRVFLPGILRQATAIGYTARAAEWQAAKRAYQIAYLKAAGLPVQDPLTCSRLLTQLAYRNEFELVRRSLRSAGFPQAATASFLRLLDMREGLAAPSEAWVLDRTRPVSERWVVLRTLKRPEHPERLLEAFRGTDHLDLAVHHAVAKGWIPRDSPLVQEATQVRKQPDEASLWFLDRPEEQVSDLLWMRAVDALKAGEKPAAAAHAKALLEGYPGSYYAGHARFLLAGLEPAAAPAPQPFLGIPGDITILNAKSLLGRLRPVENAWPERMRALAARNRFDLVLAQADPVKEEAVFLRAAHLAGQQDLVARYEALEGRCAPETVPFLFPLRLAPLVERLIREEGLAGSVDPAFVLAMIKNESIFQPSARSGANAYGIMQVLRPTFVRMVGAKPDILDPETNIRAGLRYYRTIIRTAQLESLPDEVRMLYILAGYHAGEGRARRWRTAIEARLQGRTTPVETVLRIESVPISSTRHYILRALGDRELFRHFLD